MDCQMTKFIYYSFGSVLERRIVSSYRNLGFGALAVILFACSPDSPTSFPESTKAELSQKASQAAEGWERSHRYMNAWLEYADPTSGLIPRNLDGGLGQDVWNARDCAADNYPFLVLTSYFTDQEKYQGVMREILATEMRLTSRVKSLPDTYSFSKKDFKDDSLDMDRIVFGTSEYIKDGLLPLTEWLGHSPWYDRMITMLHDLDEHVDVAGVQGQEFGKAAKAEVNGELLQVLSRMYWMTGEETLLEWAQQIGDYYLLSAGSPLSHFDYLRLRDHGCELVAGLCELYATIHFEHPEKKMMYQKPLYTLLDHILEHGRNKDGLFYNAINPQTGMVVDSGVSDGWGYMLNGYYTVYMVDSVQAYKDAVMKVFQNLHRYQAFNWENLGADGYADAIEGAINLYNRIPDQKAAEWIDSEIQVMWSMQDSAWRQNAQQWKGQGIIEGWYGDGNFARTSIMYGLWKTQGTYLRPWNRSLRWAATTSQLNGSFDQSDTLYVTIDSPTEWEGRLFFDGARHSSAMHLPMDWPRINQFPEWFVVRPEKDYSLSINGESSVFSGEDLLAGLQITLPAEETVEIVVVQK